MWARVAFENGARPPVVTWRCECGATRFQFADCTNVETLCRTVLEGNLRRTGANIDHDEALAQLVLEAWRLYLKWEPVQDPARPQVNFEGYAYSILRHRAYDIYRQLLGRNGEKPLAHAISLDAHARILNEDGGTIYEAVGASDAPRLSSLHAEDDDLSLLDVTVAVK